MPYPSQINTERVLNAACDMIEADGADKLSLNRLASHMGVKAPSLYRYYQNKSELLRAVNSNTQTRLFDALAPALDHPGDTTERIVVASRLYRAFAFENPHLYGLLFTNTVDGIAPDAISSVKLITPYQALIGQLCGDADSLAALRGWLALVHGFVMLELAGQLRRGGDLALAFDGAVRAYLRGWQHHSASEPAAGQ